MYHVGLRQYDVGREYLMRGEKRDRKLSRLIPKNHFCSMNIFREPPLIDWTFTKASLFTAYDIYRSSDFWLDEIVRSGKTLKEGLLELGFPKQNTLVVDTGVFEMEAKKAGLAKELGIDVEIQLSNEQIFEVYQLTGADYFVAPDEIILPSDDDFHVNFKVEKIRKNLLELLEIVPSSKIIAVIQGHSQSTIDNLFDYYRSLGITCFAMGGVIPLYRHSKELLEKVLLYVREITKKFWLHVFGLPHMGLLQYYLHRINIDSVDTSAILYITARRQYLLKSKSEPVRNAKFQECNCEGCKNLSQGLSSQSQQFFVNLYVHNLLQAVDISKRTKKPALKKLDISITDEEQMTKHSKEKKMNIESARNFKANSWRTAAETLRIKKKEEE